MKVKLLQPIWPDRFQDKSMIDLLNNNNNKWEPRLSIDKSSLSLILNQSTWCLCSEVSIHSYWISKFKKSKISKKSLSKLEEHTKFKINLSKYSVMISLEPFAVLDHGLNQYSSVLMLNRKQWHRKKLIAIQLQHCKIFNRSSLKYMELVIRFQCGERVCSHFAIRQERKGSQFYW